MDPASPASVAEERREGKGEGYIDPELQGAVPSVPEVHGAAAKTDPSKAVGWRR